MIELKRLQLDEDHAMKSSMIQEMKSDRIEMMTEIERDNRKVGVKIIERKRINPVRRGFQVMVITIRSVI